MLSRGGHGELKVNKYRKENATRFSKVWTTTEVGMGAPEMVIAKEARNDENISGA